MIDNNFTNVSIHTDPKWVKSKPNNVGAKMNWTFNNCSWRQMLKKQQDA